jgi:hypothetical protein
MWTPAGSLEQVLIFIDGYNFGLRDGGKDRIEEVRAFYDWLASLLGSDTPITVQAIVKVFGSEDAFFKAAYQMLQDRQMSEE